MSCIGLSSQPFLLLHENMLVILKAFAFLPLQGLFLCFFAGPIAMQLASKLPGLGTMAPLGSLPLPFGGLGLPAAHALPGSALQGPLGMHVAMYNMLLLQNPSLRSQLPPLQTYLERGLFVRSKSAGYHQGVACRKGLLFCGICCS
jgi:hypothetical protein